MDIWGKPPETPRELLIELLSYLSALAVIALVIWLVI
jgi:hypothetical protein